MFGKNWLDEFNIRDINVYNKHSETDEHSLGKHQYNILVSCYDNGLMSFQLELKDTLGEDSSNTYTSSSFSFVDSEPMIEIGQIFTDTEYSCCEGKSVFVTVSSPHIIFELSLLENNLSIERIYRQSSSDDYELIGKDMIAMNYKYMASLLFSNKDWQYIVRVYSRNETDNARGYVDLPTN